MSTSLRIRYFLDIGGQPIPFANPFTLQAVQFDPAPAVYSLSVPIGGTSILWDGVTPFSSFDMLVVQANVDVELELVVGADIQHFTLPVRGGGWPTVMPGGLCYAGQTGSQSAFVNGSLTVVSKVNVFNPSTTTIANVNVLIAKAA